MLEYLPNLLAPKFFILYAFVASGMYVHYRGRIRHRFYRQLTDHSTFMAPYNVLMYFFSAVPNRPYVDVKEFPELKKLSDNWKMVREEAMQLFDDGHIRAAAKYNDLGFNSFYRRGWKRFYVKWYDDPLPSAVALCPKTAALVQSIPSVNARDVRAAAAGRRSGQASRPVRRIAALSPRACRRRIRKTAAFSSTASPTTGATAKRSSSTRRSYTGPRTRPTRRA